ncbi:nuclear transport factor 2 family protein [Actinocrinis sp.]|uniref:nuclear transport factor 2 family protein n=1 Tax=Actinocrinis sp. TaxID=1920516 RepID=UPI002D2C0D48|nr:nuclear transport factor 2 family protein [Actinocrinis sp.]HZP52881.1 nuclear transport factor 2 family protein [Actinocrinis sp.]
MFSDEAESLRPSASVTAAGIDHVRLSYHYLDSGDIDGYGSLLDDDAQLRWPEAPLGRGRAQVLSLQKGLAGPPSRHEIRKVVASGDTVVVTGRYTPSRSGRGGKAAAVEFADLFTLSDKGMLLTHHRYYFVAP